jgi:hypothetical protein
VCIALVVTFDGFPLGYEVFAGNSDRSVANEPERLSLTNYFALRDFLFDHLIGAHEQRLRRREAGRLIISSILAGCTTGRSEGLSPLRIRPV